jgi:UDP-glucose 4-epimerase
MGVVRQVTVTSTLDRVLVVGGAGFIGSHVVDWLLARDRTTRVTVFDNLSSGRACSSGRAWHFEQHDADDRLAVMKGDVKELGALCDAMAGHDAVVHLASNPDIARAATEPEVDFWDGTYLTNQVVEAMRRTGTPSLLYASGSGVYGDLGLVEAAEDHGPLVPVSTYGASKLSGEALISAYCAMFGLQARVFRFGNVVGPRQTHGVGLDFIRKLLHDPTRLAILGDGAQSKSYVHVEDVVSAMVCAHERAQAGFAVFNVATGDYITVTEIAELAVLCLGLPHGSVAFNYSGGRGGWKGDVPVVRLDTTRIRSLGWTCNRGSRDAVFASMESLRDDIRDGRL